VTWVRSAIAVAGTAVVMAGCGGGGTAAAPAKTTAAPAGTRTSRAAVVRPLAVVNAPTRIARTAAGPVGYREVGAGSRSCSSWGSADPWATGSRPSSPAWPLINDSWADRPLTSVVSGSG